MSYEVFVESDVHRARMRLPGNLRQRMRGFISSLAAEPRPHGSERLDTEGIDLPAGVEVRRYRLDPWRLVYAVHNESRWVWYLALLGAKSISETIDTALGRVLRMERLRRDVAAYRRVPLDDHELAIADLSVELDLDDADVDYDAHYN